MVPKIALTGVGGGGINFAKIGIASLDSPEFSKRHDVSVLPLQR